MKTTKLVLSATIVLAGLMLPASAAIYDLNASTTVTVPTIYGDAIFTLDYTRPAGSGVIQPFLTLQANGTEQGYNTSVTNVYDTKRDPQFNHEIRLSDLNTQTINGTQYYSFLIDVNEPNGGAKADISLDALKIYTSSTLQGSVSNIDSLGTKVFDLDLPTDTTIKYTDANSGSGQGDIAFFVPTSAFLGASPTDYIYMYQHWGSYYSADFSGATDGGYEETAIGSGTPISFTPVPEVSALLPLLGVLGTVIASPFVRRILAPR